ncbi:hypothetical protein C5167_046784 [Papaver somniferum]|uniref:Uncharacterized protein n=1 Tax=Papaver somniferum TaxID=3469 RepID=A0A4Y7LGC6_PAPSO|nr:hypothetical protein C5167_046784 [Papaver somniferum]
MVKVVFAVVYF